LPLHNPGYRNGRHPKAHITHGKRTKKAARRWDSRTCFYCNRQLTQPGKLASTAATKDHLTPKSEGGEYTVWCCRACNEVKGSRSMEQFDAFRKLNPRWWDLWRSNARVPVLSYETGNQFGRIDASIALSSDLEGTPSK
jgi:5-methylcytosine-specific restriction endonuclease McrA